MKKLVLLCGVFCLLTACGIKNEEVSTKDSRHLVETPYKKEEFLLGTYVKISIYDKGKEDALKPAFDLVKKFGDEIDVNNAKNSLVEQINQEAGVKPVVVNTKIYQLIKKAMYYSKESKGAFDLTIGPITNLWRIGFDDARKPSEKEIQNALQLVDYRKVVLNDANHSIYLPKKGMRLDLGAIAKGFITDEVAGLLREKGVTTGIIDLGGNIYVMGSSVRGEKTPWNVGIQDPNKARSQIIGILPGENRSFVTSGIYERFLKVGKESYHHLMNPKTGYPFDNDIAGITISSKESIDGDGLSTVVFSMGIKEGLKFVENLPNTEAIFISRDDKVYTTKGIAKSFELDKDNGYLLGHLKND